MKYASILSYGVLGTTSLYNKPVALFLLKEYNAEHLMEIKNVMFATRKRTGKGIRVQWF